MISPIDDCIYEFNSPLSIFNNDQILDNFFKKSYQHVADSTFWKSTLEMFQSVT